MSPCVCPTYGGSACDSVCGGRGPWLIITSPDTGPRPPAYPMPITIRGMLAHYADPFPTYLPLHPALHPLPNPNPSSIYSLQVIYLISVAGRGIGRGSFLKEPTYQLLERNGGLIRVGQLPRTHTPAVSSPAPILWPPHQPFAWSGAPPYPSQSALMHV